MDWTDFRDHLSTAERSGKRRWLYPKRVQGRFYRARTYVSWMLLAVLFAGPLIRIHGNPLLMFNLVERRFAVLGQIFWPHDMVVFAVALLLGLTSIIIFTTAFGRLWCGWTCPQTLLMEMVFRKLECAIEGDSVQQRALAAAPWSARKLLTKGVKHAIFFGLSFVIANTLLSYIIGSEQLLGIIRDDPRRHLTGLAFMLLFTLLFYAIFARFREQACIFICPYGRFQSTVIDENTLVVAYDHPRGERRGAWRHRQTADARRAAGLGDCVNCRQCVAVCPTGIDIRDGTQMECVNCTACIDACDAVMDRLGRPRGLIRYASLNSIERGEPVRFTPRLGAYLGLLAGLAGLLTWLVFSRSGLETTLLRAPGALFYQTADGKIANLYTVKLVNRTTRDIAVQFKLANAVGDLQVMGGGGLIVPKQDLATTSVLIDLPPSALQGPTTRLRVRVYADGQMVETLRTMFIGPEHEEHDD
ncbi:MAG: cytochrome c oxidase accessory protein CcoG [Verrucomicrobia bacterium]|nr:cytochrome c oxidase accessory protein CcoG [Verrucomicrobiota bacterium]